MTDREQIFAILSEAFGEDFRTDTRVIPEGGHMDYYGYGNDPVWISFDENGDVIDMGW